MTTLKPLTVWMTTNWKILKEMRIPDHLICLISMQVKKQQLKPDMEWWTGSKLGKEYVKAVYFHSAYLTYMQSTSCKMLDWMKHKLESRFQVEIEQRQICRWYHTKGRKWRGNKEPFDEGERGEWKSGLITQHSKNKDHGVWSHHFLAKKWGKSGNCNRLHFLGL